MEIEILELRNDERLGHDGKVFIHSQDGKYTALARVINVSSKGLRVCFEKFKGQNLGHQVTIEFIGPDGFSTSTSSTILSKFKRFIVSLVLGSGTALFSRMPLNQKALKKNGSERSPAKAVMPSPSTICSVGPQRELQNCYRTRSYGRRESGRNAP
jgi:hypothetical protein